MKKPTLLVIFLTVFVDLIGFGLVLPLLPNYSKNFGASGFEVGLIMAAYSLMQFIFAPMWGSLSDRIGRRPVLLVSLAGAAVSYGVFAVASAMQGRIALGVILLSRALAGICGANITVAQAYIADITPPEERSKKMGLIGMAFGLGFIVGPALAVVAQSLFGLTGPGWTAAAICGVNFLLAVVRLPESWKPGAIPAAKRARLAQVKHTLAQPKIGLLVAIFFLATFGFTCFESTLGLLIQENFQLDHRSSATANAILFCYCGIIAAFVQAGPIGRMVKKFGEPKLIAGSLIIFGLGMAPLPFIKGTSHLTWSALVHTEGFPWLALLFAAALLAIGSGLTRPPLFGMLSILTPATEQGATLGVAQSAGSLARVIGPPLAGWFFDRHPSWPYVTVAGIAIITGLVAWHSLVREEAALLAAKAQGTARM
jgi:DHA1 family tetracycline resistance protein-like MFS transporter